MPVSERRSFFLFLAALFFLLLWSAWDYGGRYLHVQAFAQVLSAGIGIMLALRQLRRGDSAPLSDYPLLRPGLLWLLALAMSWVFSVNRLASLEEFWRWVMYLLLGLGVYGWLRLQPDPAAGVRTVLRGVLLVGVAVIAWGLLMPSAESGMSSTFYRTNDLAGYLLLLVPLALHLLIESRQLPERLIWGGVFGLLSWALLLTNSRSSWVAGLCGIALVLLLQRRRLPARSLRWLLPGAALAAGALLVLSWPAIGPRLQTLLSLGILRENATLWRLELLEGAWNMFLSAPVFGHGPNTFATAYPAFQQQPGYYSINPHCFYLQVLAETGLLGFGALMLWLLALLRGLLRRPNACSVGVLAGLAASLLHIGFDIDWSVAAIPILFAVLTGAGLVPDQPLPEQALPEQALTGADPVPDRDLRPAGVLIFTCLGLALVPSLNYFSARSYGEAQALEREDPDASLAALERAIGLAPWPSARHYYSLANQLLLRDQPEPALGAISRAIRLDHHNARYYGLASDILLALGRRQAALAMLLRRQDLNPYRHPHIYTELGDFYLNEQRESQRALEWYTRGQQIFTGEALARYERYTPADRYEAFNLGMKLAALTEKLGRGKLAVAQRARAQALLRGQGPDLYVKAGHANPVAAVLGYWAEVPEHYRNRGHSFESVLPGSQIQPPPPGRLDPTRLQFIRAERDLFGATLIYAIPRQGGSGWLMFEDSLSGDETGWKLRARRSPGS